MTTEQLARLGQQMRQAQRDYFRSRSSAALETSKSLEKQFDQACKEALEEPGLFGKDES